MAATFPSGSNTYVPEVTNKLVVDYSRNKDKFPLNQYVQICPVTKQVGYYLEMTREEAGRILNTDLKNFAWPDGADPPTHNDDTEGFEFKPYKTKRYSYGFNIGSLAVEQAAFNVVAHNAGVKAEQAMRARTQMVVGAATTSGNYDATHVSAVASITGVTGKWDVSTTARKDIKRSLDYAANKIIEDSLNGVASEDLILVISLYTARLMSISQEIVDMIKGSPEAYAEIRGELPNRNIHFGLPNRLYGYKVVVEDSVKVTSKKGATKAVSGILANTTAFMCSRVGGLVSTQAAEAPSFTTHVLFMKEEMSVESKSESWERRERHRVVEDFQAAVVGKIAGFLFTSVVS